MKLLRCVLSIGVSLMLFGLAESSVAQAQPRGGSRQKVIDFDDELVEGMNKKPLDSVSQLGDGKGRRKKPHLYRKRGSFRLESQDAFRTLGMTGGR